MRKHLFPLAVLCAMLQMAAACGAYAGYNPTPAVKTKKAWPAAAAPAIQCEEVPAATPVPYFVAHPAPVPLTPKDKKTAVRKSAGKRPPVDVPLPPERPTKALNELMRVSGGANMDNNRNKGDLGSVRADRRPGGRHGGSDCNNGANRWNTFNGRSDPYGSNLESDRAGAAPPAAPPPPKLPDFKAELKKMVPSMTAAALGAFMGFFLLGPAGILMGAAIMFTMYTLSEL